jgi:hypothetical protein
VTDIATIETFERLAADFLGFHWTYNPVDATFAGLGRFDAELPPVDRGVVARTRGEVRALSERLDAIDVPDSSGARLDARHIRARLTHVDALLARDLPFANPAWYTGEAAFGIISLLLRRSRDDDGALARRIASIPDFLRDARAWLAGRDIPPDWTQRAEREAATLARFLDAETGAHAAFHAVPRASLDRAASAARAFGASLAASANRDPACGEAMLALLMRDVHGLAESPRELEARAATAFGEAMTSLEEAARRLDPNAGWREQLARLAAIAPLDRDALASYEYWNARALADAASLVTPAASYGLHFARLPVWARDVYADLYFLFYRSPAAFDAGSGSIYWVAPQTNGDVATAHNTAAVKTIHAVHHGSVGHHTQNARARAAESTIARIAGTDCASGIAMLSAGTMVEGWACYAEDLMAEVPDFYTPAERLQLMHFEARNIACCLADLRLHLGIWSLEEMRRFYRDDVGFAPARIWSETTRNSMFPASRLMYWTGSTQIAELRKRSPLESRAFHDELLSYGSCPIAWIADEMRA